MIQKKAFKNEIKHYNYHAQSYYQNLTKNSFLYLNEDSYLHQINIIETKNNFNFEIIKTREDIKG